MQCTTLYISLITFAVYIYISSISEGELKLTPCYSRLATASFSFFFNPAATIPKERTQSQQYPIVQILILYVPLPFIVRIISSPHATFESYFK